MCSLHGIAYLISFQVVALDHGVSIASKNAAPIVILGAALYVISKPEYAPEGVKHSLPPIHGTLETPA